MGIHHHEDHDILGVTESSLHANATQFIPQEPGCSHGWHPANHAIFQLGNACIMMSFVPPHGVYAGLIRHSMLLIGFLLICTWGWAVLCAPDVFSWNFGFVAINALQVLAILYRRRKVRFDEELESVYKTIFQPLSITRTEFKKLTDQNCAAIYSLDTGQHYATEQLTRTDTLAILIEGVANVESSGQVIHEIHENQFLDSPEYESTMSGEEKFQVTVVAATPCRYLFWQRDALNYLFVKEPQLGAKMTLIVARDITNKLYSINEKFRYRGQFVDIRVPCMNSISATNRLRSMMIKKSESEENDDNYYIRQF